MSGMTPLFSQHDLGNWFDALEEQAEDKLLTTLKRAGEFFIGLARKSGKYTDHTGNLRSSIGYVIVQDGEFVFGSIFESEKGTDRKTGVRTADKLVTNLAETHNEGLVLIGVAGMEYAVYVEAIEGKEVISGAYIQTEQYLRDAINKVFDKYYGG